MAVQVNLTDKRRYEVDTEVEAVAGENSITINFPQAIPNGKKAVIRLRIRARLEAADA